MTRRFFRAFLATLCLAPGVALASAPNCPNLDEVAGALAPQGAQLNAAQLTGETAKVAQDSAGLTDLATQLEAQLPQASQAEVADLMTAAYCRYLQTSKSNVDITVSIEDFAKKANASTVRGNAGTRVSLTQQSDNWLFSN